MSGTHKNIGENVLNACILGNQSSDIDIYVIDTNKTPDNLNQDSFKNLKAAIGPVFFRETHKFSSIFQNVPLFSLSNNTNANNSHIYACGLAPNEEIKAILKHIRKTNIRSLTIFVPDGEFFHNIEQTFLKESDRYNLTEDQLNIVHYDSSANLSELARSANTEAVFVFEPISSYKKAFTLSSLALSNPIKWEGVFFAYADNEDQRNFINEYQRIFNQSPTVISLAAYDIVKMINESVYSHREMFNESYQGTLGSFNLKKDHGIIRELEIFQMLNSEKVPALQNNEEREINGVSVH